MKAEEISDTDGQKPDAGTIAAMLSAPPQPPLICDVAGSVFRAARASAVGPESKRAAGKRLKACFSASAAPGGEQTSDHPHVEGKQGKLLRQKEHPALQVSQETRVVRAQRHPVRYLGTLEQRLHHPEEVEGVLILDQRELLDGRALPVLENSKQLWVLLLFSSVMTVGGKKEQMVKPKHETFRRNLHPLCITDLIFNP